MAEIRHGLGGERLGNERLPWLEPVEDEDDYPEAGGGGGGRIALWIVIALVVAAIAFGAFILWQRHRAASADIGQIIHAPPGPYKTKPANPGGLKVDENGVIAHAVSAARVTTWGAYEGCANHIVSAPCPEVFNFRNLSCHL